MSAYADWVASVHARGGWPTRIPAGKPNAGALAAHIPQPNGTYTLELAPLAVRAADGTQQLSDKIDIAEGKIADVADSALHAVGLDHGALGLIASGIGIPYPLLITLLLGGVGVIGYHLVTNKSLVAELTKKVLK